MAAKNIVKPKPYRVPDLFPCIKEWCAYVTVTPEDKRITVFNKGNSNGFIACVPIGGHNVPISMLGDKALWKKVQNIAKKKRASDTINNPTPKFIPLCTAKVWLPKYVASAMISLNHKDIEYTKDSKAKKNNLGAKLNPCILSTPVVVRLNKTLLVRMGQGLGLTRWKGWAWKFERILFDIKNKYIHKNDEPTG